MNDPNSIPEPEEQEIHIPGMRLAALAWGPPDGEPVLALHGWLDNAASFSQLAPRLSGRRVVALDFPGHGHSDHRPAAARYHFIDYVADTLDAIVAMGWERCSLLGHSLGGAVASILAGAAPERVDRLVLVEALGPLPARDGEAPGQFARGWHGLRAMADKRLPVHADLEAAVEARVRASGMSRAAARPIIERGLRPEGEGFTWRTDPRLTVPSLQRLGESQVREYLSAIEAPVLLVAAGRYHDAIDRQLLRERVQCVRSLELCTLGGSHHLHLDDPDSVAGLVRPFLAREAGESPSC
jgi:pimeloyl-ACP methyl ester carboxylesterase